MFKTFSVNLLDALFPEGIKCIFCGRDISQTGGKCTCAQCLNKLPFNNKKRCLRCDDHIESMANFCDRCQNHPSHFDVARAPFVYAEPLLGLIHALKYSNSKYLVKPFTEYMAEYYHKQKLEADIIVPVPLHEKKLKQRGYNQAELLADCLSKELGIPVVSKAVKRLKETPMQRNLGYTERRKNIHGAFKLSSTKEIKGKRILLVDDVMTSGATVEECSRVLSKYASKITVLTVARTVIKGKTK